MAVRVAPAPTSRTTSSLRRVLHVLREEGPRNLWFKALGETVYRRLLLFEFTLAVPPPLIASEVPLDLGLLTPSDADEYAGLRPDTPADVVARRFDGGERCFVGRHEGRLVSARWLATGDVYVDYLRCWIRLAPGAVYLYDTFTAPDYRGKRVSACVATNLAYELAGEGAEVVIGLALRENRPIQRATHRSGLEPTGTVGCIGPPGARRGFVRGGTGVVEIRRRAAA